MHRHAHRAGCDLMSVVSGGQPSRGLPNRPPSPLRGYSGHPSRAMSSRGLPSEARLKGGRRMVDQIFTSWNLMQSWLRRLSELREVS